MQPQLMALPLQPDRVVITCLGDSKAFFTAAYVPFVATAALLAIRGAAKCDFLVLKCAVCFLVILLLMSSSYISQAADAILAV